LFVAQTFKSARSVSRREAPGALAIDFGAVAPEAERVVAIGADLAAIPEPGRVLMAREADMTERPAKTTSGCWGHG
jgi:hypothetical protein